MTRPPRDPNHPLSWATILSGTIVTLLGGLLLAWILQDARFDPTRSAPSPPVAISAPTLTPTDIPEVTVTPILTPTPSLPPDVFRDDFENGIRDEWFVELSGQIIDNGYLLGTGILAYDPMHPDYSFLVRIRKGTLFTVYFRDDKTTGGGLWLNCANLNGTCQVWRNCPGLCPNWPITSSYPIEYGADDLSEIKGVVQGRSVSLYMNGDLLVTFINDEFQDGRIALSLDQGSIDFVEIVRINSNE